MKTLKRIILALIFLLLIMGIKQMSYATNENITYKAEYKSSISYKITINGLEEENEDYMYDAYISQKEDITASDFLALGDLSVIPISYNKETKEWTGTTVNGEFEKQGQYYIYIAKLKIGSINYEMIDGPTKIATPALPPLGERIKIYISKDNTTYDHKVNAINTYIYRKVQRKTKFYLGEITDKALLEKIAENGVNAYGELLEYAKKQKSSLKEDSFMDNATGVLDYNIVENYNIQKGKYYFIYSILDSEDGTYVEIEDIGAYNGAKAVDGKVYLDKFVYTKETSENKVTDETASETKKEEVKQEETKKQDGTVAKEPIPQTGNTIIGIILLVIVSLVSAIMYFNYIRYKDIK